MIIWIRSTLRQAAWAPFAVFVAYLVIDKTTNVYLAHPNLDMPTHFLGGVAITYFFVAAVEHLQALVNPLPQLIRLALALGLTAITAIAWEFLEFLSDRWLGTHHNLGVSDTLSDLFFGLAGGLVLVLLVARRRSPAPVPSPARFPQPVRQNS